MSATERPAEAAGEAGSRASPFRPLPLAAGGLRLAPVAVGASLSLLGIVGIAGPRALPAPRGEGGKERALWLLVTPLLGVAFLALARSPAVIFYAALIIVPVTFAAILAAAHAGLAGGSP